MRFTSIFALMAASVAVAQSSVDDTTTTMTETTTKTVTITKCNPTNTACPLYTPTSTIVPTINSTTSSSTSSSSTSSSSSSHFYPASNSTSFAGPTASAPWTKSSAVPIKTGDGLIGDLFHLLLEPFRVCMGSGLEPRLPGVFNSGLGSPRFVHLD
ncbi:hypothetical protein LY78DRAFT_379477 [Colletotrichum sublineola]|nr:hypothetical protein LY78DRAFT_379477 [Colletotrichum sublineola]